VRGVVFRGLGRIGGFRQRDLVYLRTTAFVIQPWSLTKQVKFGN
jgi:hypothetical protein